MDLISDVAADDAKMLKQMMIDALKEDLGKYMKSSLKDQANNFYEEIGIA